MSGCLSHIKSLISLGEALTSSIQSKGFWSLGCFIPKNRWSAAALLVHRLVAPHCPVLLGELLRGRLPHDSLLLGESQLSEDPIFSVHQRLEVQPWSHENLGWKIP